MKNKIKEEIRKIYTSDYLDEDKIRALFDLLEEQYQKGAKEERERIEKEFKEWYDEDYSVGGVLLEDAINKITGVKV